jgi:hypothetical protein
MAENEIKYRVSADADQAQRELRKTAKETQQLGKVTDRTGDVAERAARQQRELAQQTERAGHKASNTGRRFSGLRDQLGKLRGSIGKVAAGWASFAAAGTGALLLLRDIAQTAREAKDAMIELGNAQKSLATNVGGQRADALRGDINRIARAKGLGKQGRNALIQAATTATDLDPTLTNTQILNRVRGTASLSRATGFDPGNAFQAANALSENLEIPFGRAVDQAALLGTSGFSARGITQAGERFAGLDGREVLSMMMAARQNIDPNTISEGLNTLRNALTRRGPEGKLAEELRKLGLSGDQSFVDKIRTLATGMETGRIGKGELQAIGGTRAQGVLKAFARSVENLPEARRSLDTASVGQIVQRQLTSDAVRAAERARRRELRSQTALEESGMGGAAESAAEAQTRLEEIGGGSAGLGTLRGTSGGINRLSGGNPSAGALERGRQQRASKVPFGQQRLQSFGSQAVQQVRQNLRNRLQEMVEAGEISQARADEALSQFDLVADEADTTVHQAVIQAEAGVGPDTEDLQLQGAITGPLRRSQVGSGVNVTINNTTNNAQQFNDTKDPETGDLDAAAQGERPN